MARKPTISIEEIEALGAKKRAALVFEEATGSAAFKCRVSAALAGQSGSEAIAKLIDRRLAGLERGRAFINWDKTQAFRDDLAALLGGIVQELGPADPGAGLDRLLRFLATLRANKSETFDCLKFTLDGAGERSDGYARTPCFRLAFLARESCIISGGPRCGGARGGDGRIHGRAKAAQLHREIQAADSGGN